MKKIRKNAKCHKCGALLIESAIMGYEPDGKPIYFNPIQCGCGWTPRVNRSPHGSTYSNAGRPRREIPDPYGVSLKDANAPPWFHELMIYLSVNPESQTEKLITVNEFAEKYQVHPTQVRRWCDQGFIHCVWTQTTYYPSKLDLNTGVRKKNANIRYRHYSWHRTKGHRRIPFSEVERCKFLKYRQHSKETSASPAKPLQWREALGGEVSTLKLIQLGEQAKEEADALWNEQFQKKPETEQPEIDLKEFEE